MVLVAENIEIGKKLLRVITNDSVKAAEAVGLVYVTSSEPGFTRKRTKSGFNYWNGDKKLEDSQHLARIRKLVLPPAWTNVWICRKHNGHLQATGIDKLGRKQYRYHGLWMAIRNQTKFFRLREFGEKIPMIRQNIKKDLALPGYPQEKVLAAMVCLLERINIRVGNAFYEKIYGSFGLTTLKNHHVEINGSKLRLMFRGKKGISHNINFSSKKLARVIQGCKDIPGKELFSYYDEKGDIRPVDSGMVNNYIRSISGSDFTAKDFRTWAGTIQSLLAFKEVGGFETIAEMNKKIPAALDIVAKQLGNTRAVCKKYYVHPVIINMYQDGKLGKYLDELNKLESGEDPDGYASEEQVLLKILRSSLS